MFFVLDTKYMLLPVRRAVLQLLTLFLVGSAVVSAAYFVLQQEAQAQDSSSSSIGGPSTSSLSSNNALYGNSSMTNGSDQGNPASIRLGTMSGTNGTPGYFDRYPFAKYAYQSDVRQPASGSSSILKSMPPTTPHPILAYTPVIKFCNDNPMQGICYMQPPGLIANDTPAAARDLEVFQHPMTTFGLPLSDTQFQIIDRENKQRFLELLFDPERWMWMSENTGYSMYGGASNALATSAETNYQSAFGNIAGGQDSTISSMFGTSSTGGLINLANEQSGFPVSDFNNKSLPQAIWMVQQMFSNVYMQMAILFLLVGATLTQSVSMVKRGFLNWGSQDVTTPFDGMLRSVIAVFLIPATQLFLSYAIDVGNTMTNCVYPWINLPAIMTWAEEQTYNPPNTNINNAIIPPGSGINIGSQLASFTSAGTTTGSLGSTTTGAGFGTSVLGSSFISSIVGSVLNSYMGSYLSSPGTGGMGKAAQIAETQTIQEEQLWLSTTMQFAFNLVQWLFTWIIARMTEFQVVLMSYMFLLGPLCAAFFAFPAITQTTFRGIFSNWINSVISVSLWRFQWCVILAIMSIHAEQCTAVDSQFEMMVAVCFLGLMMVVPFNPFTFQPGDTATMALSRGTQLAQMIAKETGMSNNPQVQQALGATGSVGGSMMSGQYASMGYTNPGMYGGGNNQSSGSGAQGSAAANAAMYPGMNGMSGGQQPGMPPLTGAAGYASPSSNSSSMFTPPPTSGSAPPAYQESSEQQASAGAGYVQPVSFSGAPMVPLTPSEGTSGGNPQFFVATSSPAAASASIQNFQQLITNVPSPANTIPDSAGASSSPVMLGAEQQPSSTPASQILADVSEPPSSSRDSDQSKESNA